MDLRLKFIGNLGKFDNLETFDSPFSTDGGIELQSSMNAAANDDTFKTDNLPSADEAFGSSMNDDFDDNEVPF